MAFRVLIALLTIQISLHAWSATLDQIDEDKLSVTSGLEHLIDKYEELGNDKNAQAFIALLNRIETLWLDKETISDATFEMDFAKLLYGVLLLLVKFDVELEYLGDWLEKLSDLHVKIRTYGREDAEFLAAVEAKLREKGAHAPLQNKQFCFSWKNMPRIELSDIDRDVTDLIHVDSKYIEPDSLPPELRSLSLVEYSYKLVPGVIPHTVKNLHFGFSYDHPFDVGVLPSGVLKLSFDYRSNFAQSLEPGSLSEELEDLRFGDNYNEVIELGVLPPNLKVLNFGKHYNRSIKPDALPYDMKKLVFGRNFDQKLKIGSLPPNLKILVLGGKFNQVIDEGVLPPDIEEIVFEKRFDDVRRLVPRSFHRKIYVHGLR